MIPDILYCVWSIIGVTETMEVLTRVGTVLRYGETTVAAMEAVIVIHPGHTALLRGRADELTIAYVPVRDGRAW